MITVTIQRYYGNANITKSTMIITDDESGKVLMECEARECRYAAYRRGDTMPGMRTMCLAEGEYELKPASEEANPICLKITHEPSRRGFKVCAMNARYQCKVNMLLIGYADAATEPEFRNLTDIDACRDAFMKVIYKHYLGGFRLIVRNEES